MIYNLIKSGKKLSIKQANLILIIFMLIMLTSIILITMIEEEENIAKEELPSQTGLEKDAKNKVLEEAKKINYDSYKKWEELLLKYKKDDSGRLVEIPNIKIVKFPEDMNQIKNVAKKKRIFFNIMLIGAYHANQELLNQRRKLKKIINQYESYENLGSENNEWLESKFKKYNVNKEGMDLKDRLKQLDKRLDVIPISLILAQAAVESGWGTSRFVTAANNIFGEWTFNSNVPGIVPKERPANANYRIRKFSSVEAAINSYLLNLNSYFAYKKLRELRFDLRTADKKLDSLELSIGLLKYSERREEYVKQLNNIIKYNNLKEFDSLLRK